MQQSAKVIFSEKRADGCAFPSTSESSVKLIREKFLEAVDLRMEGEILRRDIPIGSIPRRCRINSFPYLSVYHAEYFIDEEFVFATGMEVSDTQRRIFLTNERITTDKTSNQTRGNVNEIRSEKSNTSSKSICS